MLNWKRINSLPFAIALVTFVAFWALALTGRIPYSPPSPQPIEQTKQKTDQKPGDESHRPVPEWPSAGFWEALATGVIAVYAIKQYAETRRSGERQLRAYMGIEFGAVLFNSPSPGQVTAWVRFKNAGATPAYRLKGSISFMRGPTTDNPFDDIHIFASEGILTSDGVQNFSSTQTFSQQQLQAITIRQESFFVWGRIEYVDAFKEERFFSYKALMNGPRGTIIMDGARLEGWSLSPIPNGFDAN